VPIAHNETKSYLVKSLAEQQDILGLFLLARLHPGLAQQLQTVQSSAKIQETIACTARMLQTLNARFDAPGVARMLAEFEKQNVLITQKQEIVDDTLDSAFEVDGEADATSEAVLDVLQGVGLDLRGKLGGASKNRVEQEDAEDLDKRLQRLRI
jgi:hypothetical protein